VQSTQYWLADDRSSSHCRICAGGSRDLLVDALVRASVIEVELVLLHQPGEVAFVQDQEVIEALSAQAAQEALAGSRRTCGTYAFGAR
jgi:hypothetical protein